MPSAALDELFGLLHKSAAEADSFEVLVEKQAREIRELKSRPLVAKPAFDRAALDKLASVLEVEALLPEGISAKSAAENISVNPNILLRWMHNLATPHQVTEGRAVKVASEPKPLSGTGKLVTLAGRTLVDNENWLACIDS